MKTKILLLFIALLSYGVTNAQCLQVDGIPDLALPTDVCEGAPIQICLPYLNYSGATLIPDFTADAGANIAISVTDTGTELCIDVIPSLTGCNGAGPVPVIVTINNITCDDGGAIEACLPFPCVDIGVLLPLALDPINVYPVYAEVVVAPDCAGGVGSAMLTSIDGTVCEDIVGVTGIENVCPATDDTDAMLTYDFTVYDNQCGTYSAGIAPVDCAVPCVCPVATAVSADAPEVCSGTAVNVCVDFDAAVDATVIVDVNGIINDGTAGGTQICVAVPTDNQTCDVAPLAIAVSATCAGAVVDVTAFPVTPIDVYPLLEETITPPDCAGGAGSAILAVVGGIECQNIPGVAGAENVCPDLVDTDATLTYDFTAFDTPCFAGTMGIAPVDCAVTCNADCPEVAGEPTGGTAELCNAGTGPNGEMAIGTLDFGTIFTGNTDDMADPDDMVNYIVVGGTGLMTDPFLTAFSDPMGDLAGLMPGDVGCVKEVIYTQGTLNDFTGAIDAVTQIIPGTPIPAIGAVDLAGFLNFLNDLAGPFTQQQVMDFLDNGVDVCSLIGNPLGIPDCPIGWPVPFCYDFSDNPYCFTVIDCLVDCDPACENDLYVTIESITINDPVAVLGETVVFPPSITDGCAGTGGGDAAPLADDIIELLINITDGNGNPVVVTADVDGANAGTTAGPFGGGVFVGSTATGGTTVPATVTVDEDDSITANDPLGAGPATWDIAGGSFDVCGGAITITYSTQCAATCTACPAITAVDTPVDGCDATTQTICVTYNQDPTGIVTADINGITGTIDAAAMTICYDIPLANTTCDAAPLDIIHNAVCVDDSSDILLSDGVTNTNGLNLGPINVYPVYDVVVVPPACDGAAGSAEVQVAGVACATPAAVTGTAGVTNVCPVVPPGTPATLVYDFSADANIVAATAAGCVPTGAALMDNISTACDLTCNATCDITTITAAAPVCSTDGTTYDVTVTVAGTDASVMLDDGTGPVAAMTTTFTFASGAGYTINVTDSDGVCAFGPFTGADPACPPPGFSIDLTDPCNCDGIDEDMDGIVDYALETITLVPGTAPYTVGGISDFSQTYNPTTMMPYTNAEVEAIIAAADPGAGVGFDFQIYIPADASSVYTIEITDDSPSPQMASVSGGPCPICQPVENIPTVGEWGLIILGLLMSITAVVGIRQRREEEVYG